jgi:putative membrane protein
MDDLKVQSARREFRALAALSLFAASLGALGCRDLLTWALESLPVFLVAPLAWAVAAPPSRLLGRALFLHALVLAVGAHWTYAEVPAGRVVAQWMGQERNPYDRLGHLFQGFTPALFVREWFVRTGSIRSVALASAAGVCVALAFSALYELIEWLAAVVIGQSADAFLGTQGFAWDTQADMLCALIGALTAVVLLGRAHLASVQRLTPAPALS